MRIKLFNWKWSLNILLLMLSSGFAGAQTFDWVVGMGGTQPDHGYAIAVDDGGHVYITGSFTDTCEFPFGGTSVFSKGKKDTDVYLAKFDLAGNLVWVKNFGGTNGDIGNGVVVDPSTQDVIITGTIGVGVASFNPVDTNGNITSFGSNDVFIARYDSAGNFIWAKAFGGTGAEAVNKVKLDKSGNIYIVGDFKSPTAYFNPGVAGSGELSVTGTSKPQSDGFIAKYAPNGDFIWAHQIGGLGADYCGDLATDDLNNVYLTGWFASNDAKFDGTTNIMATTGGYDVFLVKYDSTGNLLWKQKMGGKGPDHALAIAIDKSANLYLTGYFDSDTAEFDPQNAGGAGRLVLTADIDMFIAKYDSSGRMLWAKSMEGDKKDHAMAISLDNANNLYITGATGSSFVNFNPGGVGGTVLNVAAYCIVMAKYSTNGDFKFARSMGGTKGQDWGRGIAVDKSGNVFLGGFFSSHVAEFNRGGMGGALTGYDNNYDIFLLKLACTDTSSTLLNVSTCKAYTLNDSVYTQAGSYVQRFENVIGCDSFVRLNLSFYEHTPTILPIGSTLYVREKFAAYQWMKNGADIDGATDSFYVVTENANYRVRVTEAGSDCEFTSAVYIVDNVSVSDATTFADQIKVYPNPVSGTLHIKSPVTVNAHISSMDGRLIKFVERADAVDLSQLSSGIYILRLMDLGQHVIKTEKLVVD